MKKVTALWAIIAILLFAMLGCTEKQPVEETDTIPPPKNRLVFKIELLPEAEVEAQKEMANIRAEKIKQLEKGKIQYDEGTLKRFAKEEYVNSLTLEDFMLKITPESKRWFAEFFNNFKPSHIPEFDTFYENYKKKTIKEIKNDYIQNDKFGDLSEPSTPHRSEMQTSFPDIGSITGSKMIRKDVYDGQLRYVVTTPDQSIWLRGRYDNTASPYFPDYGNVYCGACCGPAAGQSILEWFNVPVKKPDGTVLTSPNDIQKRLANLMDTEDGADYTHPDDLASTLDRGEFRGWKGVCYKDGGGTMDHVHYMLSKGTPVILLIAADDWAHYITIYAYDYDTSRYIAANSSRDYTSSELIDLWSFENTEWYVDVAFAAANVNSKTLFSYCSTGCAREWDYELEHGDLFDYLNLIANLNDLYYEKFNAEYVNYYNEDGARLNFYGYHRIKYSYAVPLGAVPLLVTRVSSGSQTIDLNDANSRIISYIAPSSMYIYNNSLDRDVDAEIRVDKRFLDKYPELYAGFRVRDEDGQLVLNRVGPIQNYADISASNSDPNNYVYRFDQPYKPEYETLEFVIHGGFRKTYWKLLGCDLDTDGDYICDEYDDDDDNDGVPDDSDNCPKVANADQVDNDENGEGLACDYREQCLIDCDPNYFDKPTTSSICGAVCAGLRPDVEAVAVHEWEKVIHSKWWDRIHEDIDFSNPKGMESEAFEGLYGDFEGLLKIYGPIVPREVGKEILWNMLKDSHARNR